MIKKISFCLLVVCNLSIWVCPEMPAQKKQVAEKPFVHPGMMQDHQSLELMKQKIASGDSAWTIAFNNLQKETPLDFVPEPRAHISVGAYNTNSSGGREYGRSATMAYNCALMWYITAKKTYADKAIRILNAWSIVYGISMTTMRS
jgi:hypothetical protein